ncbi:LysR family transcriptional regulator [Phytohabitans sp. ZYX-F-186]|uniref:LysR family transcriptional regulator n=1 Tax=Phytohabitans maris TaxID=3071409 RepID=A0ABU0ZN79_9ACTN|nr:LysR family transcriptional regulator [Phytohabitans sp. ZYX-F-186]MDQ7908506.1 LysR family transcriptional regulator [Phytohabitans sp. ZYX-F-186]
MLNVHHLRTLAEVVATGSFAAAAASLGYTASAVSQQMTALERATGLVLFERGARSARPTTAARHLAGRSTGLVDQLTAVERDARALAAGASGVVRVGSFPTASAAIVPGAIARLLRRAPDLAVLLDEGEPDDLVAALASGAVDVAVVYRYPLSPRRWPPDVVATPLLDDPLRLTVGADHPVVTRPSWGLADLAGETWIASRETSAGARNLARLCADAGFTPRVAFRSDDYTVVRELVRAGLGVALVPALADALGTASGVHQRPAAGPRGAPARREVFVLHRPDRATPLVPATVDALRRAAGSLGRRINRRAPTADRETAS